MWHTMAATFNNKRTEITGVEIEADKHTTEGNGSWSTIRVPAWQIPALVRALISTTSRDTLACPECGKHVTLSLDLDRYIHRDGTENRTCWRNNARNGSDMFQTVPALPRIS